METWSGWVLRHRLVVGLLWLVITGAGLMIAPTVSSRLIGGNHLSSAAVDANQQIAAHYGGATQNPAVLVLDLPAGQTVDSAAAGKSLAAVDSGLARARPGLRVMVRHDGRQRPGRHRWAQYDGAGLPARTGSRHGGAVVDQLTRAAPGVTVHGTSLTIESATGGASNGNSTVLSGC